MKKKLSKSVLLSDPCPIDTEDRCVRVSIDQSNEFLGLCWAPHSDPTENTEFQRIYPVDQRDIPIEHSCTVWSQVRVRGPDVDRNILLAIEKPDIVLDSIGTSRKRWCAVGDLEFINGRRIAFHRLDEFGSVIGHHWQINEQIIRCQVMVLHIAG